LSLVFVLRICCGGNVTLCAHGQARAILDDIGRFGELAARSALLLVARDVSGRLGFAAHCAFLSHQKVEIKSKTQPRDRDGLEPVFSA